MSSMFGLTKLILFSQFIVISVSARVSKSLEFAVGSDVGPTVFYYYKELPFLRYTSSLYPTKLLWVNQSNMIALEYYPEEKTFFYTTNKGELYSVVWIEEEDKLFADIYDPPDAKVPKSDNAKLLYTEKDWYPRSIALDEVGKKLYIADTNERSIDVFDLDGKNKARLFTSENVIPCEIVIDSSEGLLFFYAINFLKRKSELHRMNMDGSEHRVIVDTIENLTQATLKIKVSFSIDRVDKKLYYKASSNDISIVDYNGRGRVSLLINGPVATFEIKNNHIYWFDIIENEEFEDNTDFAEIVSYFMLSNNYQVLSSCDLRNRVLVNSSFYSCEPNVNYPYVIHDANTFKIIDNTAPKKLNNPCIEIDNGCEDHCLLKSSGSDKKLSFGCACRLGRKLNNDEKTCSDLQEQKIDEESVPYVYEKMGLLFNRTFNNATNDIADDTPILQISPKFAEKLTYYGPDVAWDDLLIGKYDVNLPGDLVKDFSTMDILRNSSENIANALAYDWVSNNLYYAKLSNTSNDTYNLFVIATRYPDKEIFLGSTDKPTSMVVHPYRGYLFIATFNENKKESQIIRLNTDGSDRLVLPYLNHSKILLTLDMGNDNVYWLDGHYKSKSKNLWSSNLDGSDVKLSKVRFLKQPLCMTLYQEHIFVRTLRKLYIFNRAGVEYNHFGASDFVNTFRNMFLTKLKIKKTDTQYLSQKDNPCVINNGGCETFCFAVPANDSKKLRRVCGGESA